MTMSNTNLFVIVISNSLDDTTETKVIAVNKETGINNQLEYIKASLDEGEFIHHYYQLRLSNKDIYCDTEKENIEVWNDLNEFGLLKYF